MSEKTSSFTELRPYTVKTPTLEEAGLRWGHAYEDLRRQPSDPNAGREACAASREVWLSFHSDFRRSQGYDAELREFGERLVGELRSAAQLADSIEVDELSGGEEQSPIFKENILMRAQFVEILLESGFPALNALMAQSERQTAALVH
jgi:hypothetical protein